MNSQIGLGVFGTFGQPFGFQQTFYFGVDLKESLDLDENAIEVYPGNELFAVKRELVNGVCSISFCMYSYVNELYSDRISTFMGTCIVLQDGYADADNIYKLLRELHTDTFNNLQNVEDNTVKVQQAQNLVVREPSAFAAVKANVIPISKTPFYSTKVDAGKKFLVLPDDNDNSSLDTKVVAFFDDSLKHFTDADTMYFSQDEDVSLFVEKKGLITTLSWSEFTGHKNRNQQQGVVRTKKGIQRNSETDPLVQIIKEESTAKSPAVDVYSYDDDPNKPFDVWEDPEHSWSKDEIRSRVREYNRLFKYTNTLQAHINEQGNKKKKRKEKEKIAAHGEAHRAKAEPKPQKSGVRSLRHTLLGSKRKRGVMLLVVGGGICLAVGFYNYFFNKSNQSIVSNNIVAAAPSPEHAPELLAEGVKEPAPATHTAETVPAAVPVSEQGAKPVKKAAIAKAVPVQQTTAPEQKKALPEEYVPDEPAPVASAKKERRVKPVTAVAVKQTAVQNLNSQTEYPRARELRPAPNLEITHKDIMALAKSGVKNRTVTEITRIIFDAVPTNVGSVYRGQEAEYASILLNTNKQAFQKVGNDFVCSSDAVVLHIPAYKSPRLPVVFPK